MCWRSLLYFCTECITYQPLCMIRGTFSLSKLNAGLWKQMRTMPWIDESIKSWVWNLFKPLSWFHGYRSESSCYHQDHFGLFRPDLLELFLQPLVVLDFFVPLLPAVPVTSIKTDVFCSLSATSLSC